ncbi:hypothetical protein MXD63_39800, partial [Frankia sp. Cpl3]|nr:hypothetical protein [Frankia sp. Cpl3]
VILAFLGYVLFGKSKHEQKRKRPSFPPILTPTHDGGFPTLQTRPVKSQVEERDNQDFGEATWTASFEEQEVAESSIAEAERVTATEQAKADRHLEAAEKALFVPTERTPESPHVEAREGMKWAMIFSPPRAKDPYKAPYSKRS